MKVKIELKHEELESDLFFNICRDLYKSNCKISGLECRTANRFKSRIQYFNDNNMQYWLVGLREENLAKFQLNKISHSEIDNTMEFDVIKI